MTLAAPTEVRMLTLPRPTRRVIVPILLVVLSFCAICGYLLLEARRTTYERAADVAKGLITAIEADIGRNFETLDLSLQGVVEGISLPEFDRFDPVVRNLILFDRSATARHLSKLYVLDKDGKIILDSKSLNPSFNDLADRDYFLAHKNNPKVGLFIGRPVASRSSGERVLALSRRLSHADGSFAGVAVATLRLSYFEEMFKKISLGVDGSITLVRSDGIVLMRWPAPEEYIGSDLGRAKLFEELEHHRQGRFDAYSVVDGEQRLFVYSQIGDLPLVVNIGQSTSDIYLQWNEYAFSIAFMIAVLCIGTYLLVAYLIYDLKRRGATENKLSILAATDALTGLSNRRHFNETLGREWHRAVRDSDLLALLMIDADNFKSYNDVRGHPAGDHMIKILGAALAGALGRGGDLGARYGGDEFAVLLPNTTLDGAKRVAAKIRARFAELCEEEDVPCLGLSIGVSCVMPIKGARASELVQLADHALYRAKELGRNRTEASEEPADPAAARPDRERAA
ncbi:MAG TPA: diguanylate cyclase [Pseudolabrys sp.]|jgi:diguanylate cyclase (GGDEF)-like protein